MASRRRCAGGAVVLLVLAGGSGAYFATFEYGMYDIALATTLALAALLLNFTVRGAQSGGSTWARTPAARTRRAPHTVAGTARPRARETGGGRPSGHAKGAACAGRAGRSTHK